MTPKVKICCIGSIEEAWIAIEQGATAIGLVGPMPSGPGMISNAQIREIANLVSPHIATFLLTSETSAEKIIRHHEITRTNTIQIVDKLVEGSYSELRNAMPWVRLVQVIHVIDELSVKEAVNISEQVDALLLDSGNPDLKIKELGGTGRTHDWSLSKRIVDESLVPVFLAGGLNSDNVEKAIEEVQPWGVDICSGVRTNGSLDKDKLDMFFEAIN